MVVQSHPPVSAKRTGKWAQAVPVPHAQAVAGQPLDNASPPAWSVPGHGLAWVVALTKEHAVLCQFWRGSKWLESLGHVDKWLKWLGFHQDRGHGRGNRPGHRHLLVECGNGRLDRGLVERLMVFLHRQVTERSAHPSDHFAVLWERDWSLAGQRTAYPAQWAELDKIRPRDHSCVPRVQDVDLIRQPIV